MLTAVLRHDKEVMLHVANVSLSVGLYAQLCSCI